jgi:hypothetical protein
MPQRATPRREAPPTRRQLSSAQPEHWDGGKVASLLEGGQGDLQLGGLDCWIQPLLGFTFGGPGYALSSVRVSVYQPETQITLPTQMRAPQAPYPWFHSPLKQDRTRRYFEREQPQRSN